MVVEKTRPVMQTLVHCQDKFVHNVPHPASATQHEVDVSIRGHTFLCRSQQAQQRP